MTDPDNGCPFCNYAGPSPILADYGVTFIIEPLEPVIAGHLLAVSKQHVTDALEAPDVAGQVVQDAAFYANRVGVGTCNLITSVGKAATQTVPHLHVHVVPRTDGDGLRLPWSAP